MSEALPIELNADMNKSWGIERRISGNVYDDLDGCWSSCDARCLYRKISRAS
jgi:hypothetical protein